MDCDFWDRTLVPSHPAAALASSAVGGAVARLLALAERVRADEPSAAAVRASLAF
jgi:hypothetical protein